MSDEKLDLPVEITTTTEAALLSIADLETLGNEMIFTTAPNTYATVSVTAAGRSLIGQDGINGIRQYLGVRPGTDVQIYDASLESLADLATAANKIVYTTAAATYAEADLSSFVRGILGSANAAALATAASLIASPGSSTDNRIVRWNGTGGTGVQSSGITIDDSDNITGITSINTDITADVLTQLGNISTATISSTQWGYLGALNQALATTDDVTFNSMNITTTLTVAGASSTSTINMNSNRITNLGAPTTGSDAATKTYVDALAGSGLQSLEEARLASTANVSYTYNNSGGDNSRGSLTAPANGVGSIDGVTLVAADRVLIKDQTTLLQNGVYVVQDIGSAGTPYVLERSADFEPAVDPISGGSYILIDEGVVNAASSYILRSDVTTVGTNDVIWDQFSTQLSAGTGLTQSGGAYNVNTVGTTGNIYINGSDQVDINGALAIAKGGTNATSYTADRLLAFNSGGTAFETTSIQPSLVVQTTATQTLTNKTLDSVTNSITANALWDAVGAKTDINNVPDTLGYVLKVSSLTPLQAEWSAESTAVDIDGLTAETTADNADTIVVYDDSASANRKMTRANFLAGISAALPSGITIVAASAGDYTTIGAAITAVSAGATIVVYPGTYAESITINKNIRMFGFPAAQNVVISGADTTSTRVTFGASATSSTLREVTVQTPSSGTNYAIDVSATIAGSLTVLGTIAIQGGGAGHGIKCSDAGTVACLFGVYHNGGTLGTFIEVNAGRLIVTEGVGNVGISTDFFKITGGNVSLQSFVFQESSLYSGTDLIDISGGELEMDSLLIPDDSPFANALHISDDGVTISMSGVHLHSSGFDILVDNSLVGTGSSIAINGEYDKEKTSIPAGYRETAQFNALHIDKGTNDDPGIRVIGELAVGSADRPAEAAFGEGDSSTVGMNVLTSTDVTDIAGATYVNVTSAAKSQSGSSFAAFPALTSGSGLFIGSDDRKFFGVKIDMTATVAVFGSGVLTWWYYNGSSWVEFNIMATRSNAPYTEYANIPFTANHAYQIRFDFEKLDADWATVSVNSLTKYWIYVRIGRPTASTRFPGLFPQNTNSITTAPVFERIKLHTNRTEINEDGIMEFFGKAEPRVRLVSSGRYNDTDKAANTATFGLTSTSTMERLYSSFAGNALDGFLGDFILPYGIDTSCKFVINVRWAMAGSQTGNVRLYVNIIAGWSTGSNVGNDSLTEVAALDAATETNAYVDTNIASDQTGILQSNSFIVELPAETADEDIIISVYRDGRGSNASDTNSGSINVLDTRVRGRRWTF